MDLNQLIEYDHWANHQVFDAIRDVAADEEISSEMHRLFAHILGAQDVWINRINGEQPSLPIWPELSLDTMDGLLTNHPKKMKTLVAQAGETIRYQNSKGDEFTNTVQEILLHLTIHGQHHRAQIAKLLRQAGTTPPGTDFIFYIRSK